MVVMIVCTTQLFPFLQNESKVQLGYWKLPQRDLNSNPHHGNTGHYHELQRPLQDLGPCEGLRILQNIIWLKFKWNHVNIYS